MRTLILGIFIVTEVVVVGLLAGCGATFDYNALRAASPQGDGFAAELGREYKEFALFEQDEMWDWPEVAHFGEKTLLATAGTVPPPESLKDRWLPADKVGELTAARARLIAALGKGAGERWPSTAARAQVRFDCWVEQQEENWQTEDIARCRDGFYAAIKDLDDALAISEAAERSKAVPAAVRAPGKRSASDGIHTFIVLFDFDSSSLGADAAPTVAEVLKLAAKGNGVRIVVNGHADRAGSESYNDGLSLRRAEALSRALVANGIAAERISVNALGERRPLIATADGVREARNRRVEVTVGAAPQL